MFKRLNLILIVLLLSIAFAIGNPSVSYSTYNLLFLGYSDDFIRDFIFNSANSGSDFLRIMSMMDLSGRNESWTKEWIWSPWKEDFSGWNEGYFKRLNLIITECKKHDVDILFTLYVSQENPIMHFSYDSRVRLLKDLFEKVYDMGITHFELINEGAPENGVNDYVFFIRSLYHFVVLKTNKIYYSGECPALLSQYYAVYMPHNWGGELEENLANENKFDDPKEIEYLEHLKNLGLKILPSSDGCKPVATFENFVKVWRAVKERNYEGWEVDIGWYYNEDSKQFDWNVAKLSSEAYKEVFGKYPKNYQRWTKEPEPEPEPKPEPKPEPNLFLIILVVIIGLLILTVFVTIFLR